MILTTKEKKGCSFSFWATATHSIYNVYKIVSKFVFVLVTEIYSYASE